MIVTVTMNPAIDKTVEIDTMELGGLNRIQKVVQDAGGKGINVSKTIKELGGSSVATGFLGGSSGSVIEHALKEYGIRTDFISVPGETRTNTKVVERSGMVTELNEPGPAVTREQVQQLITKLESYASGETLFVLAGSIPKGVDKDIYRVITEKVHRLGASVLLDADGELFAHALAAGPDIVKPNRVELEEYFHINVQCGETDRDSISLEEKSDAAEWSRMTSLGEQLLAKGVGLAVITMGEMGALFLGREQKYRSHGLSVNAHSTVGAGDAMVAALAYGWERGMSLKEMASLGMAVSAGAVTTQGTKPPSKDVVEELMGRVRLEVL